ncbi:glutaredoxin [Spizellomyces punctatus DAOM BR117]|uniref:Glutaredoxin n=1 Tax=Spizellomyces punctatus (strain DAOM BR117) TaxID=645134 RepID=A0A0L0HSH1_SPIPD|nr:glutaredoxin [Spizellomyces punctatus DAOM BR117]KND04306.1 glutaredoxin [Spizellomyces punctatus DAOM BR117]|eukprot:XP_016612345.1 glutaredoxin [Spizellomyces punctatus DAOM BR117]
MIYNNRAQNSASKSVADDYVMNQPPASHAISQSFLSVFALVDVRTDMLPTNKLVEDALSENKVVVFSKTYCPYCTKAKRLLDFLNVEYESFELDERLDGQAIQNYLKEKTRQRTVPNIFINGQHLGGSDKLHEAHASGKLQLLLAPISSSL